MTAPGRVYSSSQAVTALDRKWHGVEITTIGVAVLQIDEQALVMDEMRPGVPGCNMQFDEAIARDPEGGDVVDLRARIVVQIPRRSHRDQPFLTAERAE